jgi:hypothetical protein
VAEGDVFGPDGTDKALLQKDYIYPFPSGRSWRGACPVGIQEQNFWKFFVVIRLASIRLFLQAANSDSQGEN